ncbi:MAG: hypothetical protein WCD18_22535 [Thermosynechococcaceae cyanobacterium]
MSFVRVALVLLLLGVGAFLVLQNPIPITVTILGVQSLPLRLGLWVVVAVLCGVIAGSLLKGLMQRADWSPAPVRPQRPAAHQARRPPKAAQSPVPPSTSDPSAYGSDWYTSVSPDWSEPSPRGTATDYDARRPQQQTDAYARRDEDDDAEPLMSRDRVVDADYRVLTPPYRGRPADEWEDDFFEEDP